MQESNTQAEIDASMRDTNYSGDRQPSVELKNGKVVLKQKIVSFEKQSETLQEIVKFRLFLESRVEKQDPPLSDIPDEHKPLIAKMAHESDKTLPALTKHIRQELLPTADGDTAENSSHISDALPLSVVEAAIKSVMNRNNYGLNPPNGGKIPAAMCVWRWEVKQEFWDWLPKTGREKAEQRLAERVQARQDIQTIFNALSQHEQLAILDPKAAKQHSRIIDDKKSPEPSKAAKENSAQVKVKQDDDGSPTTYQIKSGRPKKIVGPEKLAKEKEKQDKKIAKAEKEQKEKDAQDKSRSIMANFFSKKAPTTKPTVFNAMNAKAGPSEVRSDFSKTFKPFVIKKDVKLAPINHFLYLRSKSKGKTAVRSIDQEVITIDDDNTGDVVMGNPCPPMLDVGIINTEERLRSILSGLPVRLDTSRARPPRQAAYKTYNSNSIREAMSQLTEAEIAGEDGLVRLLLSQLRDRATFPGKVLIFHGDARPGYFGTWTRSSKAVGARTPFAKDLIGIDYSYDSGEEWEDEGAMDADDVVGDDDEEPVDEEPDSDLDSWLVDDDDIDASGDLEPTPPELPEPSFNPPKRKVQNEDKKSGKRRKVVVPLVPFSKGPCWESAIGHCDYEPFKTYRIRLLNDTPFPVDPFGFVSLDVDDPVPGQTSRNLDVGTPLSNGTTNTAVISSVPKRLTMAPKHAFPDTHLPFLLTKITTLQAASITFLVEAIYQELRIHKVKKNAIEAKVREVGEKCKERKVWVVKSAFKSDMCNSMD